MDAVADLISGHIRHEKFGDRFERAHQLDFVTDDVEHAAALQAFALLLALEADLHPDRERRACDVADEVDMDRRIADWIDLNVAGQNANHVAVDLEVVEAGKEAPPTDLALQHVVFERDGQRVRAAAVDDGWRAAFAP